MTSQASFHLLHGYFISVQHGMSRMISSSFFFSGYIWEVWNRRIRDDKTIYLHSLLYVVIGVICDSRTQKGRSGFSPERPQLERVYSYRLLSCPHVASISSAVFTSPDAHLRFVSFRGRALKRNVGTVVVSIVLQRKQYQDVEIIPSSVACGFCWLWWI